MNETILEFFFSKLNPFTVMHERVFWMLFAAMAGIMLARVVNPVMAQQVVGMITGVG